MIKVIRYLQKWTLKQCPKPCIFQAVTKSIHVPYQTIEYDDKGMFQAKLMDDPQVQIFIDNGATPYIRPLIIYNKYPIL